RRVRLAAGELLGTAPSDRQRHTRIALIGLRGAGKSTLGRMLAEQLGVPFLELNQEIERIAGCSVRAIHDLYGANAYRRYERRALE
ncbi:shikimate kinase, partial [Staphylococcus aureus]|nr:shikimate kinase [Staphylococcus aureus]